MKSSKNCKKTNKNFVFFRTEKEILEKYPNLERLNQKTLRKIGGNIEGLIKEIENDLKTHEIYEEGDEMALDISDFETSKEENRRNMSKLKRPLSSSLKIENEKELESQISVFKQFLQQASEEIETLRNKYITRIGKNKIKDLQRRSLQSFHVISEIKKGDNEENKANLN